MSSFEVVAQELTSAASSLEAAADAYGCYELPVTDATAENYGHVELAGWVQGVGQAFDKALEQLQADHGTMAGDLRASAAAYQASDARAQQGFALPWLDPGSGTTTAPGFLQGLPGTVPGPIPGTSTSPAPGPVPSTTGRVASRLAQ